MQTSSQDSLKSVVQTIDFCEETREYCFGGFDKTLKFMKVNIGNQPSYEMGQSLYLEGLPIRKSAYVSCNKLLCAYLNKPFVSFVDSGKQ